MAKKNSSKTATEKAIQSSEPRVMSYGDWQGVNYVDSPLTWRPLETERYDHRQTDLPKNYLMLQNNIVTTDTLGLETRPDSIDIGTAPTGWKFTGVSMMYKRWLFCVARKDNTTPILERVFYRELTSNTDFNTSDHYIELYIAPTTGGTEAAPVYYNYSEISGYVIEEIGFYENNFIATARNVSDNIARVFTGKMEYKDNDIYIEGIKASTRHQEIYATRYVKDVTQAPKICSAGMAAGTESYQGTYKKNDENQDTQIIVNHPHTVRVEVCYAFTTKFGGTKAGTYYPATVYTEYNPSLWSAERYLEIYPPNTAVNPVVHTNTDENTVFIDRLDLTSAAIDPRVTIDSGITGIDFYARDTENIDWVFIGHIDFVRSASDDPSGKAFVLGVNGTTWNYRWVGNMTDISQWTNAQLMIPTENTTEGPNASHFAIHDSRLYYWGDPTKPYRLYIGGVPGAEFSVARGHGGAWVDIEPGSGYDIKGTAKWKTVSGANIVTIMCGNSNTNKVKRFNLVETNITITNEISYKGFMYEEVSNVVGCNSRWGYGVFADGLYSVSRYGLYLTTMAMEYNSQMRNQSVSDTIKPLFSERIGTRLKNARIVYIDDIIYLALGEEQNSRTYLEDPIVLDQVILCYDIMNKSWYTFTHDQTVNKDYVDVQNGTYDTDCIHHILSIDSDEYQEGLGVITDSKVFLYPTTGIQDATVPIFDTIIETGELMPKEPMQVLSYVQQIELRFDYFLCDPSNPPTVLVEGTDYYGRSFSIERSLNISGGRGYHGKTGEMRDYVEWIRVDKYVESYRIRIKGKARFRLSHINVKYYQQADVIGTQYGFDTHDHYKDAHGTSGLIHHYINDYNNLRRALVN